MVEKEFEYKGSKVQLMRYGRHVQLVGGTGDYNDYRVYIDGIDVSAHVLYAGEFINWEKYAREYVNRLQP